MAKRRRSVKGLAAAKKTKGGRKCPAGKAFRKKKIGGRTKWVCVSVKRPRRGVRRRRR